MLSPHLKARIRETCGIGLENWYRANIQEADKPCYNNNPYCRTIILEEAQFIEEELQRRKNS